MKKAIKRFIKNDSIFKHTYSLMKDLYTKDKNWGGEHKSSIYKKNIQYKFGTIRPRQHLNYKLGTIRPRQNLNYKLGTIRPRQNLNYKLGTIRHRQNLPPEQN